MAAIPVSFTMTANGDSAVYETGGGSVMFSFTDVGGASLVIKTDDATGTFTATGDADATVAADGTRRVIIRQGGRVMITKTGHTTDTKVHIGN